MNYRCSSRHLIRNAKSALLAAIEIYNKPVFQYRDENFVILLLNAWELALKALLSKNSQSIFYPKVRKQPHRTLSLVDALLRAEKLFPRKIDFLPVKENLTLLATYRDNAVHFYNEPDFGVLVYSLAQTSIVNLTDLMAEAFRIKLEDYVSWHLLPLGLKPPIDPIAYITKTGKEKKPSSAAKQFIAAMSESQKAVETSGTDAGRLMTVFNVRLESVKKIDKADLVVGVSGSTTSEAVGPLLVTKLRDPNVTHPLRQTEVVAKVGAQLHGLSFTTNTFQAVALKFGWKTDQRFCWKSAGGELTRYSEDIVAHIKRLSKGDIEAALQEYRDRNRKLARSMKPR